MQPRRGRARFALLLALLCCGCASIRRAEEATIGADPAPSSGFTAGESLLARPSDPAQVPAFDRSWTSDARDWRRFPKLYVAPVDTGHVLEAGLWDKLNIRHSKVTFDTQRLARELRRRIEAAFRADPEGHFELVERPDEIDGDTVVLELALVELVPNKAVLGVIGLVAWGAPLEIGIPVATATAFVARGSIAIEARVRAGDSGRVIALFADRENGKMRVIDLRSLTWYGNAYETMDEWGDAFVALANSRGEAAVRHAPLFTFKPW